MGMTELYISTFIDWVNWVNDLLMGTSSYIDNIQRNQEEVFKWCMKLETHLRNYERETIPNEDIKKMLQSCINVPTRRHIIPFFPHRISIWKMWKRSFFFTEMLNRFSQEKYEENQKYELLDRKQERQEDNKG